MKIGFVSLGCPKNLVDSEVMLGIAEQAGHEITPDSADADVLVVNTCAFIDRAKQESIDTILEMAALKNQREGRRLVVTGCLAERYRGDLKKEIPEIDTVLGTGEVSQILKALSPAVDPSKAAQPQTHSLTFYSRDPQERRSRDSHEARSAEPTSAAGAAHERAKQASPTSREAASRFSASTFRTTSTMPRQPRKRVTPSHYAYVKIAEGCDYKCAFCVIPEDARPLSQPLDRFNRA